MLQVAEIEFSRSVDAERSDSRDHHGRCPLKIDWFATRGVSVTGPRVIHEVRESARPLSDHDVIGVDIQLGS